MFKRLESPWICAQLLPRVLQEMNWVCLPSDVEIKTADFYFPYKQRYNTLHLFTYRVLAFSEFPVGTSIKTQARNPVGAMRKLHLNHSPANS